MVELKQDQIEFLKRGILYCVRKLDGVKKKTGDRSIFVHILKNCLTEYTKGLIDYSDIGVVPIRLNEILITAYGNEIVIIKLKSEKDESFIDLEDQEYTFEWKIQLFESKGE